MRWIDDSNTSRSMSGEANTTAPIRLRGRVAVAPIELAQAFQRQHGAHAVGDDVHAAGGRVAITRGEHALERIARPHRAFAIIGVVEEAGLGGPGEHHRLAAELDAVGQPRGVERRAFESLPEAVHIDQHVGARRWLGEHIADLARHRLDARRASNRTTRRGEREGAGVRRRQLRARDADRRRALRPVTTGSRVRRSPACAWSRLGASDCSRAPRRRGGRRALGHAGAAAERQRAARAHSPLRNARRDGRLHVAANAGQSQGIFGYTGCMTRRDNRCRMMAATRGPSMGRRAAGRGNLLPRYPRGRLKQATSSALGAP